jgi:ABC-2 type transport system ATP-binding protein
MIIVEVTHLTHRFRFAANPVLTEVGFVAKTGESIAIVGRNGAGKTTLLDLLVGKQRARSGTITVFGCSPFLISEELNQKLAYYSGDQDLYRFLTPRQLGRFLREFYSHWEHESYEAMLGDLAVPVDSRLGQLSTGERAKTLQAAAIAARPGLLVLDEPFEGIDSRSRTILYRLLREQTERGATLFFSAHRQEDVERTATRVIALHDGAVALDSPLGGLATRYRLRRGNDGGTQVFEVASMQPETLRFASTEECPVEEDALSVQHLIAAIGGGKRKKSDE